MPTVLRSAVSLPRASRCVLDESRLQRLVHGGAILGAGGGGSIAGGLAAGRRALAVGQPHLTSVDALPDNARVVTLSGVGTVGKAGSVASTNSNHTKALKLFRRIAGDDIAGFIGSEVGATAVTYGWHESAAWGLPIVDAPCNGRAHPLGVMGSLNLHRSPTHLAEIAAVGGQPGTAQYLEFAVKANVTNGARLVRQAVAQFGVSLAVVRNPVSAGYLRKTAAVGALAYAARVGQVFLQHRPAGLAAVLRALSRHMGGRVLSEGTVRSNDLAERSGFTVGTIVLRSDRGEAIRIPVCNEFMLVLRGGAALAAFPDLITVFDARTALPLDSAAVQPGQRIAVFTVPRRRLKLAATMRDPSLLRPIEVLLGVRFPPLPRGERHPARSAPTHLQR